MNWNNQATTMMNAWAEGQKQLLQNWNTWAQNSPAPYSTMTKPWRDMMAQGLQNWPSESSETAKHTAQKLFANQDIWMRFFEFSTNAWQSMMPNVAEGEEWEKVIANSTNKLRQEMLQYPEKMLQAAQNATHLWQMSLTQMQTFSQPWMSMMQQTPDFFNGNPSAVKMNDISGLYFNVYEETFGRWLQSPTFGLTREINDKIFKAVKARNVLDQSTFDYQLVVIETWVQAFEAWMKKLAALAQEGQTITTLRELITQWNDVADEVFLKAFKSERYIRTQGAYLNAQMAYQIEKREVVDFLLEMNDLPTRNEIDEAHRHIYEQNRDIKALKKTVAAYQKDMDALRAEMAQLAEEMKKKANKRRRSKSSTTKEPVVKIERPNMLKEAPATTPDAAE